MVHSMNKSNLTIDNFVEVELNNDGDFLKVKETLSRIGIASVPKKELYQTCHILHKKGKYYICHFKELFALDGKNTNFNEEDLARRNTIIKLLEDWELVAVINYELIESPQAPLTSFKILSFKDKKDWTLVPKYTIGKFKK